MILRFFKICSLKGDGIRHLKFSMLIFGLITISSLQAQAPAAIDSLKSVLRKATVDTAKVNLYEKIAYEYIFYRPDSAIFYIDSSLSLAEDIDYEYGIANAYNRKGTYYITQTKYAEAIRELQKALPFYQQIKDSTGLRKVFGNMGALEFYLRDYPSSLHSYQMALQYADSLRHTGDYSMFITNLSAVHRELKNLDSAVLYAKRAIRINELRNDERLTATAYYNLGVARYREGNFKEATELLDVALSFPKLPAQFELLAKIYYAQSLIGTGELAEAALRLERIESVVDEFQDQYVVLEFYKAKMELYEIQGNEALALDFAKKYIALNAEIHNREQVDILQKLKVKFDIRQKESENEILRGESRLHELQLKNQRNLIWSVVIFGILLLVVLTAIFRMYRDKSKSNKLLKEKQLILNQSNKDLETINKQKNNLFSIVAHDVKSPVSAIITSVNMLRDNRQSFTEEEMQFLTTELSRQSTQLYGLLEGVLAWARSQMDGYHFTYSTIELKKLLEKLCFDEKTQIEQKNLSISFDFTPDLKIVADRQVLEVILRNLLNNAVKFTPSGGKIVFEAGIKKGEYFIAIKDSGIGIEEDKIKKVLEDRQRYTRKGTQNEPGNGIGLILCNEIARKMGGRISAVSVPGNGSVFTLQIPVKK